MALTSSSTACQDKIQKIDQRLGELKDRMAAADRQKAECQARVDVLRAELADSHELLQVSPGGGMGGEYGDG
jgi:septal ring factor EnvC (AmiA/AmiB activator)